MKNYLFIYHGGNSPKTEEEGKAVMQEWMNWFEKMGDAVVDSGNPVGLSTTVHSDGSVTNDGGASGYSVIKGEGIDEVVALAQTSPILSAEGSIEIAEVHEVK